MKVDKPEINDAIKGRRLTNTESMYLLLPDLPLINTEVLEKIIEPFLTFGGEKYENKI